MLRTQEKETRVKFNTRLSANRSSNNWALMEILKVVMRRTMSSLIFIKMTLAFQTFALAIPVEFRYHNQGFSALGFCCNLKSVKKKLQMLYVKFYFVML